MAARSDCCLTCTSCDILLVAATLRMTELAQLEEFILLHLEHCLFTTLCV